MASPHESHEIVQIPIVGKVAFDLSDIETLDQPPELPHVDLRESPGEFTLCISFETSDPKEFDVTVCGRTLRIASQSPEKLEDQRIDYARERHSRSLCASMSFPEDVDAAHTTAEYQRDTLVVHLRKFKSRHVPIVLHHELGPAEPGI
ncbi:MAG: Hsp20/alpha crystallin family protein [Phycisphaerales bacterium]